MGGDIGSAIKNFKSAVKDGEDSTMKKQIDEDGDNVIDAEVKTGDKDKV